MSGQLASFFRESLYAWAAAHPRPMPWKGEKDPYKIWLSEIILQQTRVEQGLPYYEKFIERYPDVQALALAPEDEVLKLWEGLGYYSRARNLHAAAKHILSSFNSVFPRKHQDIRALKGVGDYTAAAISSFAYNEPHAVLDGNVYRIIARFFAIETPVDLPQAKKQFAAIAAELLDPINPGKYNQALMDFGALCCTPAQPGCRTCPLNSECAAYGSGKVSDLPVKQKKQPRKQRYFLYLVPEQEGLTFIRKRNDKDIWRGLYEFPSLEMESETDLMNAAAKPENLPGLAAPELRWGTPSEPLRQILTHREVIAVFLPLHLPPHLPEGFMESPAFSGCFRTATHDLKKKFAVHGLIARFLQKKG